MQLDDIKSHFTRGNGSFVFARWGRPLSPIVFGVEDETLAVFKGALEAVCAVSGHKMAETDPELGSNLLIFFCRDWSELLGVPDLDKLVTGLKQMVAELRAAGANQYRVFRFDPDGSIKAAFVFLRMDDNLAQIPAQTLALSQVVQVMLLWSDQAFQERAPLAKTPDGQTILRPEIAGLLRACYDPVLPASSRDTSFALRLAARLAAQEAEKN